MIKRSTLTVLLLAAAKAVLGPPLLLLLFLQSPTSSDAFAVGGGKSLLSTTLATKKAPPTAASTALPGFLGDFLETLQPKTAGASKKKSKNKYEAVVVDQDFRVAGLFVSLGLVLDTVPYVQYTLGPVVTALGALFVVQTLRIRFVFDEDNCLELKTVARTGNDGNGNDGLRDSGENVIVGGANRWACDTIVNYDFFPQAWMAPNHPIGPILVYFKETQTDAATWNDGPGRAANDARRLAEGTAVPGQVHFFPAVCNAQQIRAEFERRGCGKIRQAGP